MPFCRGYDVIQQAQSGTGKTATFCAGILHQVRRQLFRIVSLLHARLAASFLPPQLDYNVLETQALVLGPTRELAQQIEKARPNRRVLRRGHGSGPVADVPPVSTGHARPRRLPPGEVPRLRRRHQRPRRPEDPPGALHSVCSCSDLPCWWACGRLTGPARGPHLSPSSLQAGVHVVVGTPGRVYDVLRRRALRPDYIKIFALDEADEMLSRGFKDQIYDIFQMLPTKLQAR